MSRRWRAPALVATLTVLVTSCAADATEPGIPADTNGPLTADQASALVEVPLRDLVDRLRDEVPAAVSLEEVAAPVIGAGEDGCSYTSSVYRSQGRVGAEGWAALADEIRPQMDTWQMDTGGLENAERSAGAGLRGENPFNGARLTISPWNGETPEAVDGPTRGVQVSVEVPLQVQECEGS